jgi:hypothetical protein
VAKPDGFGSPSRQIHRFRAWWQLRLYARRESLFARDGASFPQDSAENGDHRSNRHVQTRDGFSKTDLAGR